MRYPAYMIGIGPGEFRFNPPPGWSIVTQNLFEDGPERIREDDLVLDIVTREWCPVDREYIGCSILGAGTLARRTQVS